jgi:hypothetical protein
LRFLAGLFTLFGQAIPALTYDGYLPEGVHDCTLVELQERFGQFQTIDARCRLFERFEQFVREATASGLVTALIVDGSFVTDKDRPNDIDVILVLRSGHDFAGDLRPFEYNVVSRLRVRRQFGFDVLAGEEGRPELEEHVSFFAQVRKRDELRKGMLRIKL